MGRGRSTGRVSNSFENGGVGRKPKETHVVDDSISNYSSLAGLPLADNVVDYSGISSEDIIKCIVTVNGEDVRKEWMVTQVRADGWVVDEGFDTQGRKIAGISYAR